MPRDTKGGFVILAWLTLDEKASTNVARAPLDPLICCSPFGILIALVVLAIFILKTMRSAADDRSTASMLMKTAAAYMQVPFIARTFCHKWPSIIVSLFDAMDTVSSVSDALLNSDCTIAQEIGPSIH